MYPDKYKDFVTKGFGHENNFFIVGKNAVSSFPYVLMGPFATHIWAGYALHRLPILFQLHNVQPNANYELKVNMLDVSPNDSMFLRTEVNGVPHDSNLPAGKNQNPPALNSSNNKAVDLSITIAGAELKEGPNEIALQLYRGRWAMFDNVSFNGPGQTKVVNPGNAPFVSATAAAYEMMKDGKRVQPLLLETKYTGQPVEVEVEIDGKRTKRHVEEGRAVYEIPMELVNAPATSTVKVYLDNQPVYQSELKRKPAPLVSLVDYVNQFAGSSGSRWMIGPGPWMPFGMTKIMPDNEDQRWKAGYEYQIENIAGFNLVHEWTMTGLLMLPATGDVPLNPGPENDPDMGYRSRIDKKSEVAKIGYYAVNLTDYNVKAELTATTRATMQRYTFPKSDKSKILIDFFIPSEYSSTLKDATLKKVSNTEIEGSVRHVMKHTDYHGVQDYTLHFVIQLSRPFESIDGWIQDMVFKNIDSLGKNMPRWGTFYPLEHVQNEMGDAGVLLNFKTAEGEQVSVRTGISLVSSANARLNLTEEINRPFGWDFEKIVQKQREVWNGLLGRVQIESDDYIQKESFTPTCTGPLVQEPPGTT